MGAEIQYIIYRHNPASFVNTRLFLWGQAVHFGDMTAEYIPAVYGTKLNSEGEEVEDYDNIIEKAHYGTPVYTPNFGLAAGFGFDVIFGKHVCIPVKFGLSGDSGGIGLTFGTELKYIW